MGHGRAHIARAEHGDLDSCHVSERQALAELFASKLNDAALHRQHGLEMMAAVDECGQRLASARFAVGEDDPRLAGFDEAGGAGYFAGGTVQGDFDRVGAGS